MSTNQLIPQSGILNLQGSLNEKEISLAEKDDALVLKESRILATSLIDTSIEPKVVGIDISAVAYDEVTELIKAETISSLTTQEVLGVAITNIASSEVGELVALGIITSTLVGVAVGDAVYATASGTLSLTVSQKRIGYILTTGASAKVFIDIKTKNDTYYTDEANNSGAFPTSLILPYTGASAPTGWLLCNGSSQLVATYPNLFAVIGYSYGGSGANFNVPDYRGMFLRGSGSHGTLLTAAGGAFAGPALHASQLDMEQSHRHLDSGHTHSGNFWYGPVDVNSFLTIPQWSASSITSSATAVIGTQTTDGVNGTPRIGAETRPVSYGVTYIIKV